MNLGPNAGKKLIAEIIAEYNRRNTKCDAVIFAVPFVDLAIAFDTIAGQSPFGLAAQNVHQEKSGAFTGEISASMLAEMRTEYVIVGHSERRQYFGESDATILQKARIAIEHGLKPIYCFGETLEQRESGDTYKILEQQLRDGVFGLSHQEFSNVILAYEPVWAIGTGKTASPDQAQEVHAWARNQIHNHYNPEIANATSILYGGSVKADNATLLFACPDIDGGLVGGASLKAEDFAAICESFI